MARLSRLSRGRISAAVVAASAAGSCSRLLPLHRYRFLPEMLRTEAVQKWVEVLQADLVKPKVPGAWRYGSSGGSCAILLPVCFVWLRGLRFELAL